MMEDLLHLGLQLDAGADADEQEIEESTARLRRQLLELDVESVDLVRAGEAPPGTRAADIMILGGLLVTLSKSPELLKMATGVVQSWVAGRPGRSVELQINGDSLKVTGISSDQQRELIAMFVERHSA
jgi:hypothetical protein